MKHGELSKGGEGRYCNVHEQLHGPLYPCWGYSPAILKEIKEQEATLRWNLRHNPKILEAFLSDPSITKDKA